MPPRRPIKKRPTKYSPSSKPARSARPVRSAKPAPPAKKPADSRGERIQKVLAAAGLGSRRQCEELITTGRVEIDRKVVTELGSRVDAAAQEIRVDGQPLPRTKLFYYAVNKPAGVVCTNSDPSGRTRVIDMVPNSGDVRLFAIGRLDMSSEGLILVTNDGELANLLTHPRYGVEKTYRVLVAGRPEHEILAKLRRGVHLAEGVAKGGPRRSEIAPQGEHDLGDRAPRREEPRDPPHPRALGPQGHAAYAHRRRPDSTGRNAGRRGKKIIQGRTRRAAKRCSPTLVG